MLHVPVLGTLVSFKKLTFVTCNIFVFIYFYSLFVWMNHESEKNATNTTILFLLFYSFIRLSESCSHIH